MTEILEVTEQETTAESAAEINKQPASRSKAKVLVFLILVLTLGVLGYLHVECVGILMRYGPESIRQSCLEYVLPYGERGAEQIFALMSSVDEKTAFDIQNRVQRQQTDYFEKAHFAPIMIRTIQRAPIESSGKSLLLRQYALSLGRHQRSENASEKFPLAEETIELILSNQVAEYSGQVSPFWEIVKTKSAEIQLKFLTSDAFRGDSNGALSFDYRQLLLKVLAQRLVQRWQPRRKQLWQKYLSQRELKTKMGIFAPSPKDKVISDWLANPILRRRLARQLTGSTPMIFEKFDAPDLRALLVINLVGSGSNGIQLIEEVLELCRVDPAKKSLNRWDSAVLYAVDFAIAYFDRVATDYYYLARKTGLQGKDLANFKELSSEYRAIRARLRVAIDKAVVRINAELVAVNPGGRYYQRFSNLRLSAGTKRQIFELRSKSAFWKKNPTRNTNDFYRYFIANEVERLNVTKKLSNFEWQVLIQLLDSVNDNDRCLQLLLSCPDNLKDQNLEQLFSELNRLKMSQPQLKFLKAFVNFLNATAPNQFDRESLTYDEIAKVMQRCYVKNRHAQGRISQFFMQLAKDFEGKQKEKLLEFSANRRHSSHDIISGSHWNYAIALTSRIIERIDNDSLYPFEINELSLEEIENYVSWLKESHASPSSVQSNVATLISHWSERYHIHWDSWNYKDPVIDPYLRAAKGQKRYRRYLGHQDILKALPYGVGNSRQYTQLKAHFAEMKR